MPREQAPPRRPERLDQRDDGGLDTREQQHPALGVRTGPHQAAVAWFGGAAAMATVTMPVPEEQAAGIGQNPGLRRSQVCEQGPGVRRIVGPGGGQRIGHGEIGKVGSEPRQPVQTEQHQPVLLDIPGPQHAQGRRIPGDQRLIAPQRQHPGARVSRPGGEPRRILPPAGDTI